MSSIVEIFLSIVLVFFPVATVADTATVTVPVSYTAGCAGITANC